MIECKQRHLRTGNDTTVNVQNSAADGSRNLAVSCTAKAAKQDQHNQAHRSEFDHSDIARRPRLSASIQNTLDRCGGRLDPSISLSFLRLIGQALAWNENTFVPETETLLGPAIAGVRNTLRAFELWFLRWQAMRRD